MRTCVQPWPILFSSTFLAHGMEYSWFFDILIPDIISLEHRYDTTLNLLHHHWLDPLSFRVPGDQEGTRLFHHLPHTRISMQSYTAGARNTFRAWQVPNAYNCHCGTVLQNLWAVYRTVGMGNIFCSCYHEILNHSVVDVLVDRIGIHSFVGNEATVLYSCHGNFWGSHKQTSLACSHACQGLPSSISGGTCLSFSQSRGLILMPPSYSVTSLSYPRYVL